MSFVLTCDCGARFEVDDLLAGQDVPCPECRQNVRANVRCKTTQRTCWLALVSLVLALFGAFTVVGSLTAVVMGALALLRIRRSAGVLAGERFAFAGIVLGLVTTPLTLGVGRLIPAGGWIRRLSYTGRIEEHPTTQVTTRNQNCSLVIPSQDWHLLKGKTSGDPAVGDLQVHLDALLVCPRLHAFADLSLDPNAAPGPVGLYWTVVEQSLRAPRKPLLVDVDGPQNVQTEPETVRQLHARGIPGVDGHEGYEWSFDVWRGGQPWRFVIRAYRKKRSGAKERPPLYLIRVYAPRRVYEEHDDEFRALLDSARFSS